MRKKRTSFFTSDERGEMLAHQRELGRRIDLVEAELVARGSVYAPVPRQRLLAFAIERAEAEMDAKRSDTDP